MAGEPVDRVFVALTADASALLDETDRAIDETVQRAEEGGEDFAESFAAGISQGSTQAAEQINRLRTVLQDFNDELDDFTRETIEYWIDRIEQQNAVWQSDIQVIDSLIGQYEDFAPQIERVRKEYDRVVKVLEKMEGKAPAEEQRQQFMKLGREILKIAESSEQGQRALRALGNELIKVSADAQGLEPPMSVAQRLMGDLGNVASGLINKFVAFASIATLVKKSFDFLKSGTMDAIEFSETLGRIAIAQQLMSARTGEAARSTEEQMQLIARLTELYDGSQTEVAQLVANLSLLSASYGLNNAETDTLIESSVALARVWGKDVLPIGNQVATFIATGYTQALEKLGIDLTKANQEQVAYAMGLGNNLDALTEAEQQQVRFNTVVQESEKFLEGAAALQGTYAGRVDRAKGSIKDQARILGQVFAPAWTIAVEIFAKVVTGFVNLTKLLITIFGIAGAVITGFTSGIGAAFSVLVESIRNRTLPSLKEMGKAFVETFQQTTHDSILAVAQTVDDNFGNIEENFESLATTVEDSSDRVQGELDEMTKAFIDAARRFDEGMADIQQRYEDQIADIESDFAQKRADARLDLERDLRDIDLQAAEKRIQATRDYLVADRRLREDHMIEMRRLEARFLLSLEDAVRERDARAVLQLQRRYNLEKQEMEEDFDLRRKRLKENFQMELAEIERQRQLRRQQRILEFQEQLIDLQTQEGRRREQARINRMRRERDLIESINRRLQLVKAGAEGELAIEQAKLEALYNALYQAFGPNGWYEQLYARAAAIASGASGASGAGTVGPGTSGAGQVGQIYAYQRGGSFIAGSPMNLRVGERPEQVDITPINQATGAPLAGHRGGGAQDRIQIELKVNADDRLIVEVADQTMGAIADVVVNMQNQRSVGGGRFG